MLMPKSAITCAGRAAVDGVPPDKERCPNRPPAARPTSLRRPERLHGRLLRSARAVPALPAANPPRSRRPSRSLQGHADWLRGAQIRGTFPSLWHAWPLTSRVPVAARAPQDRKRPLPTLTSVLPRTPSECAGRDCLCARPRRKSTHADGHTRVGDSSEAHRGKPLDRLRKVAAEANDWLCFRVRSRQPERLPPKSQGRPPPSACHHDGLIF